MFLSEPAEEELKGLSLGNRQEVAQAIPFLEDDRFREQNKVDLCLVEDEFEIYCLVVGIIWLAFYEDHDGSVKVVWLSMRSRFRPF